MCQLLHLKITQVLHDQIQRLKLYHHDFVSMLSSGQMATFHP